VRSMQPANKTKVSNVVPLTWMSRNVEFVIGPAGAERTIRLETPHKTPVIMRMQEIYPTLPGIHIVCDLSTIIDRVKRLKKNDEGIDLVSTICNIIHAIDHAVPDLDEIYIEQGERWARLMADAELYACYAKALYDIKLPFQSSITRRS
jgi:hypothetical protein